MQQVILEKIQEKEDNFSEKKLRRLEKLTVPKHVAIIMDGNRRWAENRGKPAEVGHWMGAEIITDIVMSAADLGVKTLTLFAFSTENWCRSKGEVDYIMHLFDKYLLLKRQEMIREGVKLHAIGDLEGLPNNIIETLEATLEATKNGKRIDLVLALNYGGRDDIRRAALKAYDAIASGKMTKEQFTEKSFAEYLDTAKWGDPQLLIRTSGEMRISNFLIWQIAYSEVIVMDTLWPDFTKENLLEAILEYQKREKRFGK